MSLVDKIYLIKDKHRHSSVKNEYLHVKKIIGGNLIFKVMYCDICKKFICPVNIYERNYKGKINDNIFINSDDFTFVKDSSFNSKELGNVNINEIESFKKEHLDHNICERILNYKNDELKLVYCNDCDCYGTELNYYYNIKNNLNLNEKYIDSKTINTDPLNNINDSIEFLIRINNFRCNVRKHNIEEISAIVYVFDSKIKKLEQIEINAFYCKNCNLYFIYENEYEKLLKRGIPICPIHEEVKYFNKSKDFDNYNMESLLRQFGYNVNAQENLSSFERHKIIETILENGFMTKNEILSHLSFLYNSRKNLSNMARAVSKWNDDITFVNTLKNTNKRVVKIGAFRKFKRLDKNYNIKS